MVCWPRPQNDDVRKPRGKPTAIDHDSGMTRSKTYGTVSADTQKQMSGLEFVQGLVDGTLPLNTMARTLAYDVTEAVSRGRGGTAGTAGLHPKPAGTPPGGLSRTLR